MTMMFPEEPCQGSPKYHLMWEGYGESKAALQDYRDAEVQAKALLENWEAKKPSRRNQINL